MSTNTVKFTPEGAGCLNVPALFAGPADVGSGYVFQAITPKGEVVIETAHATFEDAVMQIARSMKQYAYPTTEWRVSDSE